MYEFHYDDYIKNKYGNKSRLLFTNTDSFVNEIETKIVYDDFSKNKEMFYFSKYSQKSKFHDNSNALVVDKINDEMGGVAIHEFVRLKPKMYSILFCDSRKCKKSKRCE